MILCGRAQNEAQAKSCANLDLLAVHVQDHHPDIGSSSFPVSARGIASAMPKQRQFKGS